MSSDEETKGISALLIVEVIGKPPEHLIQTLEDISKKIDDEKGVKVISKKINEPKLMKDQKDFYTTFAEIEVETEEIFDLVILMFKYMPAHIEILSPEVIALTNNGWNEVLNEVTRRLHSYDEIARIIQTEKGILEKKLKELMGSQGAPKASSKSKKK
ncbi:MAG: hypothetical protein WDZ77_00260 [Candidatus Pacearchaeota archaeon]